MRETPNSDKKIRTGNPQETVCVGKWMENGVCTGWRQRIVGLAEAGRAPDYCAGERQCGRIRAARIAAIHKGRSFLGGSPPLPNTQRDPQRLYAKSR